jgi:ATP-binding cassette, subfamily C, bacterial exporter for protease/lipase
LLKTVRELKAKGKTVFLITHRAGAVAVADRLLMLHDGRIIADGPRDAVLAKLRPPQPPRSDASPPLGAIQPA